MGRPRNEESYRVKRPPNAFFLFSQQVHHLFKGKHGKESSKIVGSMWKSLPEEVKRPYIENAKHMDEVHRLLYPNFLAPHSQREELCDVTEKTPRRERPKIRMIRGRQDSSASAQRDPCTIEPAPWDSPPTASAPIRVKPPWSRRRRRAKHDKSSRSESQELSQYDFPPRPKIVITDPKKVRFRIVPAKKPYTYISREEKKRRKEAEERKKAESQPRDEESIHIVANTGTNGGVTEGLSTPVLVKCNRKRLDSESHYDDDADTFDLLNFMPFSPMETGNMAEAEPAPQMNDQGDEKSTETSQTINSPNLQAEEHTQPTDSAEYRASQNFDITSFITSDENQNNHLQETGRPPSSECWWNEFEFLCSPMSKASISFSSKTVRFEESEDPLQPASHEFRRHMLHVESPELDGKNTSLSEQGCGDLNNNTLDDMVHLSLPQLSESDLEFFHTLPTQEQGPDIGKDLTKQQYSSQSTAQQNCSNNTRDHAKSIDSSNQQGFEQATAQEDIDSCRVSCADSFSGSCTSTELSYTTTPTEKSLAKLTPSPIEDAVVSRIQSWNSSSDESLCLSKSNNSLQTSGVELAVSSEPLTLDSAGDIHPVTSSTPNNREPDLCQSRHPQSASNHLAYDLIPASSSSPEHSPDLSPFLNCLANMTSPLGEDSLSFLESGFSCSTSPTTYGVHQSLQILSPTCLGKITETPRTPVRTTQHTLMSLKQHPISKLTSPNLLQAGSNGCLEANLLEQTLHGTRVHPFSKDSPRKHPSSERLHGSAAKRKRYTDNLSNGSFQNQETQKMISGMVNDVERNSLDTETQSAVEALLGIQF